MMGEEEENNEHGGENKQENNSLELIESYLLEEMSEKEKDVFDQQIKDDPSVAKEKADLENAIDLLAVSFEYDRREKLKFLFNNNNARRKRFRRIITSGGIAALLLIGLLIGRFLLYQNEKPAILRYLTTLSLAEVYPDEISQMGAELNGTLSEALENYRKGHFKNATVLFEKVLPLKPKYPQIPLFLGISELKADMPEKAIQRLSVEAKQAPSQYSVHIYYYLGFAYLKTDQPDLAIAFFQKAYQLHTLPTRKGELLQLLIYSLLKRK